MICERCGCTYTETVGSCPMCGEEAPHDEHLYAAPEEACSGASEFPAGCGEPAAPAAYAGFWLRFFAVLIDGAVLGLFSMAVYMAGMAVMRMMTGMADPEKAMLVPQFAANALMKAFYFVYFHAVTGQTAGKRALGIKVVQQDGKAVGWARSAVRYFASIASMLALGLGYFWVAFDSRKQGWHDKIAATIVVRI